MLLAVGLGLGVGPASAHGGGDQVTASVSFHDPDCEDDSASWHGLVNGQADAEGDGEEEAELLTEADGVSDDAAGAASVVGAAEGSDSPAAWRAALGWTSSG